MHKKIPTYSICNLLGADRCITEFVVMKIRHFMEIHSDLYFPHRHDFYQIVLFTNGGGKHAIDFRHYDIEPWQVYYMSPGQIHTWDFDATTDGYIVNFHEAFFASVYQNPHFLREFPLFNTLSVPSVNTFHAGEGLEIAGLFAQMLAEFESNQDYKTDLLRSLLTAMLIKLSRLLPNTFKEGASRHNIQLMRQFESLIEQHFHEKRLPKSYAEMLFISPNHLNALTQSLAGMSAGDLIRERVLLEAKRLLVNSDLLIGQIADRLNFEDNAYFTRFFKKSTGVTPEMFRVERRPVPGT